MNNDLHDIDDLFRSKLDNHQEVPSSGVKESLDATLDKRKAESFKRRVIPWKRTALVLLLLLTGLFLYESGIREKGSRRTIKRTVDKQINFPSGEKLKQTDHNNVVSGHTNNADSGSYTSDAIKNNIQDSKKRAKQDDDMLSQPKQKENTRLVTNRTNTKTSLKKSLSEINSTLKKNNPEKEQSNPLSRAEKKRLIFLNQIIIEALTFFQKPLIRYQKKQSVSATKRN